MWLIYRFVFIREICFIFISNMYFYYFTFFDIYCAPPNKKEISKEQISLTVITMKSQDIVEISVCSINVITIIEGSLMKLQLNMKGIIAAVDAALNYEVPTSNDLIKFIVDSGTNDHTVNDDKYFCTEKI